MVRGVLAGIWGAVGGSGCTPLASGAYLAVEMALWLFWLLCACCMSWKERQREMQYFRCGWV